MLNVSHPITDALLDFNHFLFDLFIIEYIHKLLNASRNIYNNRYKHNKIKSTLQHMFIYLRQNTEYAKVNLITIKRRLLLSMSRTLCLR